MSASRRAACCGVSRGSGLPASGGATRTATGPRAAPAAPRTRPRAASSRRARARARLRLRHARRPRDLRDGTAAQLRRALALVGIALERIVADALVRRQPRGARRRRDHRRGHRRGHGLRPSPARPGPTAVRRQRRRTHGGGAARAEEARASRRAAAGPRRAGVRPCESSFGPYVASASRRRAGLRRRLEAEDEVADVDLVALADDRRLRDLPAVDVRAVGALQVGDDEPAVAEEEARVVLRDVALREHQVVALDAPDVDLVLVEGLPTLGAPLFADDDREHSGPSGGRHTAIAHTERRRRSRGIVEGGTQRVNCVQRRSATFGSDWSRRRLRERHFARHLSQKLAGQRDDVARLEAAAAELAVDGLREDGERSGSRAPGVSPKGRAMGFGRRVRPVRTASDIATRFKPHGSVRDSVRPASGLACEIAVRSVHGTSPRSSVRGSSEARRAARVATRATE